MIRERISITGGMHFIEVAIIKLIPPLAVVRPLEPVSDIPLFSLQPEEIGYIKESAVKRYLNGKAIWDHKYQKLYIKIQRRRDKTVRHVIQEDLERLGKKVKDKISQKISKENEDTGKESVLDFGGIDQEKVNREIPPASSIVARKDVVSYLFLSSSDRC
jgi:hypothetical protein